MTDQDERRAAAIGRLGEAGFCDPCGVFVAVNILLVAVWASTERGYFWPIWPFLGWGIGVAFHGSSVYSRAPISEEEIRREMEKGG